MNAETRPLHASFRARGMNFKKIALLANIEPEQFSAMLARRRRGRRSWPHVKPHLMEDEQEMVLKLFGSEVFHG